MSDISDSMLPSNGEPKKRRRQVSVKIDKSVQWTREMHFALIASVEEYPSLWDARCPEYGELIARVASWKRIAEDSFENEITVEQLKKKWQLLCQTHSKKLTEAQAQASKTGELTASWHFWDVMEFLRKSKLDKRKTYSSIRNKKRPSPQLSRPPKKTEPQEKCDSSDPLGHPQEEICSDNEYINVRGLSPTPTELHQHNHQPRQTQPPSIQQRTDDALIPRIGENQADQFTDFGEYVAAILRQMPPDFADQTMAELQYSLSLANSESSAISLRRSRLSIAPAVTFEDNEYYLFGEREEPYDAEIHREMRMVCTTGCLVKNSKLRASIAEVLKNQN